MQAQWSPQHQNKFPQPSEWYNVRAHVIVALLGTVVGLILIRRYIVDLMLRTVKTSQDSYQKHLISTSWQPQKQSKTRKKKKQKLFFIYPWNLFTQDVHNRITIRFIILEQCIGYWPCSYYMLIKDVFYSIKFTKETHFL